MIGLLPAVEGRPFRVLCLGAHSDDIEIGAGGLVQRLCGADQGAKLTWCVLSADGERGTEAEAGANHFAEAARSLDLRLGAFRDGYLPYEPSEVKDWLTEQRKSMQAPDIVLTHTADDAHQDHRFVNELAWSLWRDALILEFEIPKWDGDLGRPNAYVPLERSVVERKIKGLENAFASQRGKDWFDPELFRGLMRLRGSECRSPSGFAEAFRMRKAAIHI